MEDEICLTFRAFRVSEELVDILRISSSRAHVKLVIFRESFENLDFLVSKCGACLDIQPSLKARMKGARDAVSNMNKLES